MAQVVSTQNVTCPGCGAVGIVRIWSCGCQGTSASGQCEGHNRYPVGACIRFFSNLRRDCGQSGDVKTHE
jgi:hypothetical protein